VILSSFNRSSLKAPTSIPEILNGQTPLERAAFGGHKKVIELLIASGADIEAKNNRGLTPVARGGLVRADGRSRTADQQRRKR
jgi:ankyrin repeat protein